MGRPGPNKTTELADCMYWCQQIHTHSGLSFREIEARLLPPAPHEALPDGKDFERYYKGLRAMAPDALQSMVARARKCGLLPARANGIKTARDERIAGRERSSEQLKKHLEQVRAIHKARRLASAALRTYAVALAAAGDVLAFDPRQADADGQPREIGRKDVLQLADRVDAHAFLDLGPWSAMATKTSGAEVVQLRAKTTATDRKTKKAGEKKRR